MLDNRCACICNKLLNIFHYFRAAIFNAVLNLLNILGYIKPLKFRCKRRKAFYHDINQLFISFFDSFDVFSQFVIRFYQGCYFRLILFISQFLFFPKLFLNSYELGLKLLDFSFLFVYTLLKLNNHGFSLLFLNLSLEQIINLSFGS